MLTALNSAVRSGDQGLMSLLNAALCVGSMALEQLWAGRWTQGCPKSGTGCLEVESSLKSCSCLGVAALTRTSQPLPRGP